MIRCTGFLLALFFLAAPFPIVEAGELSDEMKRLIRSRYGIPAYDIGGNPNNLSARFLNWENDQPLWKKTRTWTGTNGQTLSGKLNGFSVENRTVEILTESRSYVIALENFSGRDQQLLWQFRDEETAYYRIKAEAEANLAAKRNRIARQAEEFREAELERRIRALEFEKQHRSGPFAF